MQLSGAGFHTPRLGNCFANRCKFPLVHDRVPSLLRSSKFLRLKLMASPLFESHVPLSEFIPSLSRSRRDLTDLMVLPDLQCHLQKVINKNCKDEERPVQSHPHVPRVNHRSRVELPRKHSSCPSHPFNFQRRQES